MTEIAVLMYTLEETAALQSTAQVREWADVLDLPPGPLTRRNRSGSFTTACTSTIIEYTAEDGTPATIRAGASVTKPQFISFNVLGPGGKLAEIKYFVPRRTEVGTVTGSHAIKTMVGRRLTPADRQAVKAWLEAAEATFERSSDIMNWHTVRRLVRNMLASVAVPVRRQRSTYFCYGEHFTQVKAVAELLRRCAPDGEVFWFPLVESRFDPTCLAASADDWLLLDARALEDAIETWMLGGDNPERRTLAKALKAWREEAGRLLREVAKHESRLRSGLPATRASLKVSEEMTLSINPSAHLLTVTKR